MKIVLEKQNIIATVKESKNEITFHLDRIEPYEYRYVAYMQVNGRRFDIQRFNSASAASMYKELMNSLIKAKNA